MATSNVKSYNNYSGNGASTEFSIDFPYIKKDFISVYLRRYGGEQQKLTVDVDYEFLNDTTIKFPKEGSTEAILQERDNLSIQRETPRGSEYIFSNQKRLFPEDVMDADDLSFQQIQELESTLDRTIKISQTATGTKIPNLTIGTIKPNKGLKWNEDGITIESTKYDPDEQADIAMGQAAIATEKANEAAQSASEAEDYNNQAKLWAIGTIEEQPEGSAKYWVDKVLSTDWDDFRKKSVRMPFDVFFSLTTETPEGAYPLWTGETISNCNTAHPEFWELLLEKKESGTIKCVSSEEYQANLNTYGQTSAFVVDENAGSVRLPKITRFISSLTQDSDFAKIDLAGAPSITHKHMIPRQFSDSGSGYMGSGNGPNWDGVYTAENTAVSPIYGRSNTIQPEAVRLALYIQVDSNSSNAIALMTTLSLKELQEEADRLKEELSQIAGKQNLSELDDVTITDPQNNQALIYKDGSWINRVPCTNGVGATFVGVGATAIGSGVAVGWNSNSTSIAAAIGHDANALGSGSVALGDGSETTTNATYGTALGFGSKSDAKGATQIGWGENSEAHTFKVSLMESETGIDIPNYTLLKSGGIIPPERLPILKGTTAPGSTTVGVVGQTYVDTTNEAAYVCVKADIENTAYTWEKVSNESAGATALSELEDVTITTPTDGQGLVYDGEKWKNKKVIVNTGTYSSAIGIGINSTSSYMDSISIGNNSISDSDGAIAIGRETKAQGNRVVVIGGNASATSDAGNGIAIGTYAKISGEGAGYQIAIGAFSAANAERSIQLGGLGTNDEAYSFKVGFSSSKNYKLLDGNTGHIPAERLAEIMIVSNTAPTTATVGALGDLYKDTSTGTIYKCTAVDSSTPAYTWSEFGAGGGETIDAYTKTETDTLLSQCVQVVEQNLTDEQKTQARENVEAAPTPIISSTDPTEDTAKQTGQIYVNSTKGNAYIYRHIEQDWTNPMLSKNGTPGGSSFAVFDVVNSRWFDAYNAFDGIYDANSGWQAKSGLPGEGFWALGWYNPKPVKIEKFVVYNRYMDGHYSSGIKNFVLQGSVDGVKYVDIQSYSSTKVAANRTFVVDNPVNYYKYHRLKITSYNSGPSDTGPCIEELVLNGVELQGGLSWIPLSGNNSVSYTYQSLTDDEKEQARENIGAASVSLEASLDEKLAAKQDTLTEPQLAAVNSGITSDSLQTLETDVANNTSEIADLKVNKQNVLTAGDNITITDDGIISATGSDVDLTGYLKNNATRSNSIAILGTSTHANTVVLGYGATSTGQLAVAVGNGAKSDGGVAIGASATTDGSVGSGVACGGSAKSTGHYSAAMGHGAQATAANAAAFGGDAKATATGALQFGSGKNTEANTFYAYLNSTNYKLLDADGTIPAERLVNAPGGMEILSGTDYPNPDMVGEIGQVYIKTDTEDAYMCTDVMAVEESTGTTYTYTWKEISYVAPIQPTISVSSGNLPPDNMTSGNPGDIYIEIVGEFAPDTYVPYICTNYDIETGETTWAKIVSYNYAPGSFVKDFDVAASGSEYTALSDGFVWATRDNSQGWVQLRNKETLLSTGTVISNYGSLFLPVSAGDKFTLEYYEGSVTLKMVVSKGEGA